MLAEGPTVEEVEGVGSTVAGAASGVLVQRVAGSHRALIAPGIVAQWPELTDEAPVTPAVRHGV